MVTRKISLQKLLLYCPSKKVILKIILMKSLEFIDLLKKQKKKENRKRYATVVTKITITIRYIRIKNSKKQSHNIDNFRKSFKSIYHTTE